MMEKEGQFGVLPANVIKWIAIVFMILDHIAWKFVVAESAFGIVLHTLGRVTAPVMFFFISEGYHFTKNLNKYAGRLTLFAILAEVPYSLFMNQGTVFPLAGNVMITLLCSLLALVVYNSSRPPLVKWGLILGLTGVTYWTDWSFAGVLITLAFGIFYGNRKNQFGAYTAISLVTAAVYYFKVEGRIAGLIPVIVSPVIVMGLLGMYNGKKGAGKASKWAFYIIYPLQFLVILLISNIKG